MTPSSSASSTLALVPGKNGHQPTAFPGTGANTEPLRAAPGRPSILDLFAGPGGWTHALNLLGLADLGIEINPDACATRTAAGHATLCVDVAALDPVRFTGTTGLIGSSPCQTFSAAGKLAGLLDLPICRQALDDLAAGTDTRAELREHCHDPRSLLIVEPLRYALALSPQWIAIENVPATLPLLIQIAAILRSRGYQAWTGLINAADHGLPQIRRRALLLAHTHRRPRPPHPTHASDACGPDLFGPGLSVWRSMATALGLPPGLHVRTRGNRSAGAGGNVFSADRPAWALTEKTRSWKLGNLDDPDGWRHLTSAEAATLQGFPPDYAFAGSRTAVFRQIADAVPPPLAVVVLSSLLGLGDAR
ncbi:DNA cytosine methyltransferase [Nonomuraea sp. NPDC050153]|uniref:DNA cytosine methyltransferase n=1 Tax=Nonomuraea sp. NPDC050153 TaxID=3364359 RepID=UPI0037A8FEAE